MLMAWYDSHFIDHHFIMPAGVSTSQKLRCFEANLQIIFAKSNKKFLKPRLS